jgi:hypothetical protein
VENVVDPAILWELQLISHDPYPYVDPIGPEETRLELLYSTSFDRRLSVRLEA